jgi:hypothetical protein
MIERLDILPFGVDSTPDTKFETVDIMDFGGQGGKQKPPPKIRGSQFVKREQKQKPKLIVKKPFIPKRPK